MARADTTRFLSRLLRRPTAVICLAVLLADVGVAIVAPLVLPHVVHEHAGALAAKDQLPSSLHWLGTDSLGRDVLDRLLVGTTPTMLGVVEALIVVIALGIPLGVAAGYLGGWMDRIVGWLADLTFAMPAIIVVLVVLAVYPQSMPAAMVALGVIAAPGLMRVVRSAVLPVREQLYIAAARVDGLSDLHIMTRHVVPRIVGPIIVQLSLLAAVSLQVQTALAFLHLVVAAPAPSWGGMTADGLEALVLQPWLIWPPGIAIAVTTLALGVLGAVARDVAAEQWSGKAHRLAAASRPRPERGDVESDTAALLEVRGLRVVAEGADGPVTILDDVGFALAPGEVVGLVGESGCGKTMTALSVLGLLPAGVTARSGSVRFRGRDLLQLSQRELRAIRGRQIAFISQDPVIGLDPLFRVGDQLVELVRQHRRASPAEAKVVMRDLLDQVRLPDPETTARAYPHQLSGGMAQRVAIARALAGEPDLLIADEPTTALDVTVQAEILDLLRELCESRNVAVLLVTHDWGVVSDLCGHALVMYAGQVVEHAPVTDIVVRPRHHYTAGLLASDPHRNPTASVLPMIPGSVPEVGSRPTGCRFRERCAAAEPDCLEVIPLRPDGIDRLTRCAHPCRATQETVVES